jgi:DeoR family suf operon transcriptional repressor
MSYSWEFSSTSAGKVLKAIQFRGRATIKDVATDLGVTTSAVRMPLTQLQARGAIQADKVREGVGRPHYAYSVTPEANSLFYKDYGDLARILLEEVTRSQGPDALPGILRRVADRLASLYRDRVWSLELADRVGAWAELLDQRGVSVEIEETTEGYVVREYGCPYQNVAVENRAVCEMERQVMARLLESGVQLTQCVLDGHHGCHFVVAVENLSTTDEK